MARKNDAEKLLRDGSCPSEIANHMGVSVKTAIQYLCTQVGEGTLRLSDIYFSWPSEKRAILQQAGGGAYPDHRLLSANGLCSDEFDLFHSLRGRGVFRGDMYEYISEVEIALHQLVRMTLEREFGDGETGWWRSGIPKDIRKSCVSRREEDDEPCEQSYPYTTLIELSAIISKNWAVFKAVVPTEYAANRKELESALRRLNRIRNAVMHPVKERKWTEDDFEFVRSISGRLSADG